MERFVSGDIVVLPFPFSNLSTSKCRPALVLADLRGQGIILCQITSQQISDSHAVTLNISDMSFGRLPRSSNIRPNRIFTGEKSLILYKAGQISQDKYREVLAQLKTIFNIS